MVRRLASSPGLSVSQLAEPLPIGLPTVMKHLTVLDRAGLIERRKSGRTVTVTLRPEPMAEATAWLEQTATFWSERLARLAVAVEENARMTALTIVRHIKAPPRDVFAMFVEPAKIALWWGPDAGPVLESKVDARSGGHFHVRFQMEDGSVHGSAGAFEEFDPPRRLSMTWAWDREPEVVSRVEVDLRAVDGGTELTFTHAGLTDEATRDGHERGWIGALDKLEAAMTPR